MIALINSLLFGKYFYPKKFAPVSPIRFSYHVIKLNTKRDKYELAWVLPEICNIEVYVGVSDPLLFCDWGHVVHQTFHLDVPAKDAQRLYPGWMDSISYIVVIVRLNALVLLTGSSWLRIGAACSISWAMTKSPVSKTDFTGGERLLFFWLSSSPCYYRVLLTDVLIF